MIEELGRIGKEAVMCYSRCDPSICIEGRRGIAINPIHDNQYPSRTQLGVFRRLFTHAFSVSRLYSVNSYVHTKVMNWKVLERKRSFHNQGITPEWAAGTEENNEEPLVRIAGAPAEIRTEHLPNATLDYLLKTDLL
jgi:hypothetical protein